MKNIPLTIILLCLCFSLVIAQQTPQFQITMHFEDAFGNKDSVLVGYDETAAFNQLNPQFGEALIEAPFSGPLEVRAMHGDPNQPPQTSKKIIGHLETSSGNPCGAMEFIRIVIKADNFPLTVRYDTMLLNADVCRSNVILSPDQLIFTLENWHDARVFYCLFNTNTIIDDFEYYFHEPENFWFREILTVEGQGIIPLPGYYFGFFINDGYCATISDTDEAPLPVLSGHIYPNPTNGAEVVLDLGEILPEAQIVLYDVNGKLLRQLSSSGQQQVFLDLQGLSAGAYIVGVATKDRQPAYYKLIRQ